MKYFILFLLTGLILCSCSQSSRITSEQIIKGKDTLAVYKDRSGKTYCINAGGEKKYFLIWKKRKV